VLNVARRNGEKRKKIAIARAMNKEGRIPARLLVNVMGILTYEYINL
jgi:hypothetical protein